MLSFSPYKETNYSSLIEVIISVQSEIELPVDGVDFDDVYEDSQAVRLSLGDTTLTQCTSES